MLSKQQEGPSHRLATGNTLPRRARRLAVLLGTVLLAVLLAVHFPVTQRLVLERVSYWIESETGISVLCGGGWWLPFFGIHVRDLEVRLAGNRVLSCPEAALDFEISFRRPWIGLRGLRLTRPFLRLQKVNGKLLVLDGSTLTWAAHGEKETTRRSRDSIWSIDPEGMSIQIVSGEITALQNGSRVLDIKGINGSLVLKPDGEIVAPFVNLDPFKHYNREGKPSLLGQ